MTTPITGVPVQLGTSIQPGPDGQPWIMYEFAIGLTRMAMLLPPNTARQLPALVADMTTQALDQIPATSALILPPGAGSGVLIPTRPVQDLPPA